MKTAILLNLPLRTSPLTIKPLKLQIKHHLNRFPTTKVNNKLPNHQHGSQSIVMKILKEFLMS